MEIVAPGLTFRALVPADEATATFRARCLRVFARALRLARDARFGARAALVVNLVPSPAKRRFPPPGVPIGPEHINGGFTYVAPTAPGTGAAPGAAPAEIYVLRREEFPKVILHEILHHSRVHRDDADWAPHLPALYARFGISSLGCATPSGCATDLRPNEAVVEAWATVQHCAALARELGVPLVRLLAAERDHAAAVAARAERHRQTLPGAEWQERTHAFSYLQLRARILSDLPGFAKAAGAPEYDPAKAARWLLAAPAPAAPPSAASRAGAPHGPDTLRMSLLGDL